jgi:hypothetical protein
MVCHICYPVDHFGPTYAFVGPRTKGLYRGSAKGRGGGGGKYIGYKIIVATKPAQRRLKILGLKSFSFRSKSFIEKEKKKKKKNN